MSQKGNENAVEGRNAVIEAIRAGKSLDRLYVQDGLKDGPIQTILREAKKTGLPPFLCDEGTTESDE